MTMDTPDLPVLITYGAWIAPVAVLAMSGLLLGATELWRRWRERRRVADEIAVRMSGTTAFAPGYVAMQGQLHGSAASLVSPDIAAISDVSQRSETLWIDVAGERVDLVGEVRVLCGTRRAACWGALPKGTPAALRDGIPGSRRRLFAVGDGDDVFVQGVLQRGAEAHDTEAAGYRDDAGAWTLRAVINTPAIELIATQPATVPEPRGLLRTIAVLGTVLAFGYGSMWYAGRIALEHGRELSDAVLPASLQLAAALPGSRAKALDTMAWELRDPPATAIGQADALALHELADGCPGRARWLVDHARFDDALASARGCDAAADARALAHLGRYAEAADVLAKHPDALNDTPSEAVEIQIGASHWSEAAAAADQVAARFAKDAAAGGDDARGHSIVLEWETRARCLAEWLRAKAGDPAAPRKLASLARRPAPPACGLAAALLEPTADARAHGLAAAAADGFGEVVQLAAASSWLDGGELDERGMFVNYAASEPNAWRWLLPFAPPAPAPDTTNDITAPGRRRDDDLHEMRVGRALILGDLAVARAEADAVVGRTRIAMIASAAVRTDRTPIAWDANSIGSDDLTTAIAHRNGEPRPFRFLGGSQGCRDEVNVALHSAVTGDGEALAAAITHCDGTYNLAPSLLGVLPRIKTHRDQLADALARTSDGNLFDELPFKFLEQAAVRRDALHLVGADAAADRWQAIVTAQVHQLADRDRAVAWLLMSAAL
jgi:hypothetical protein